MRTVDLASLGYTFARKPLLIGGMAMEYYGLPLAGDDIDFVVTRADYAALAALHPDHLKDLAGDLGVCVGQFELWTSIRRFDYTDLLAGAEETDAYFVITLEKLLLLKALAMDDPKYERDVRLIARRLNDRQYGTV
jgi:hypothetical protein